MKIPQNPPHWDSLFSQLSPQRTLELIRLRKKILTPDKYVHWDKVRRLTPPEGISMKEWWMMIKLSRIETLNTIELKDSAGVPFQFAVPSLVSEALHQIDLGAGGMVSFSEQVTNPQTRDRYLINSLIEEAITSSQLEGAVTTRQVAKEMIRTGRKPVDQSEQMILNNYATMQHIRKIKHEKLTKELVFEIHQMVTDKTMEDPTAAGRFRTESEARVVGDDFGQIYHQPPPADELQDRLERMCAFANAESSDRFIHPAVRAIILHFWLAYDHPFIDGNGRTARALFYWAMLHTEYWLFELISISSILRKAPIQYARSFLYTETDDNDLTYFLVAQTQVIQRSIRELHLYIERKTKELRDLESRTDLFQNYNHRQVALIRHALKHPGQVYTFSSHQNSHKIVYQTARVDLLKLAKNTLLEQRKRGREIIFIAPKNLSERLNMT